MAMIAVRLKIDGEHVVTNLQEAREKLDTADGEMVLDFSTVLRVDAAALRAMEELSAAADSKGVKLVLWGTGIGVYKVLKLTKLASRFAFAN